jgi:hypothetical protein
MYANPAAQVFKIDSVTATTATLSTGERRPYSAQEWPSQVVITWPTARPVQFAVGVEFILHITSK